MAAGCSPSAPTTVQHTTLYVVGSWGGTEERSFLDMVKPWEARTGNRVAYEGTRDLGQVVSSRVARGDPPDLAALTGPLQLAQLVREGKLVSLDSVFSQPSFESQYGASWLGLGSVNGHLYGIAIKAELRDVIWYDPNALRASGASLAGGGSPMTWQALTGLADQLKAIGATQTPWCLGLEGGVTSGSTGAEWIQEFLLRTAGPGVYEAWAHGKVRWTDPRVVRAWQQFGGIVDESYGGHPRALTINFLEAGNPLFATPPGCYLLDQSPGFWRTFQQDNPTAQPVSDFDFFAFPDINLAYAGAEQVTGDLVSVFKDSPAARSLIAYLATPQAQAGWAQRGDTLSANRSVPLTEYPDPLSEQAARILTQAPVVVFDAGAILPPDVDAAFLRGVLDYVKDPASLPAILAHLNQVQTGKASPSSGP